jgi:anti-sigma factor RsiW
MSSRPIDDERLSAWLDGELDAVAAAEVQAWLAEHPEDAARVRQWDADRQDLRAHYAAVLEEPVPPRLRAAAWQRVGWPRWAQAAMAAGLLVTGALGGGGAVWQWQQRPGAPAQELLAAGSAQGWVQRAALAHAVYVPEPRHAVEVKAQEAHLAGWLTRRIEVPVKLFDLHAQGFELIGGRLLPDGPGKSAQLMYQDAQARRVTIYLRKPDRPDEVAFKYERQGELGMFYWIEDGCGYALVGALPRETLLALAEAVYQQHAPPAPRPAGG